MLLLLTEDFIKFSFWSVYQWRNLNTESYDYGTPTLFLTGM